MKKGTSIGFNFVNFAMILGLDRENGNILGTFGIMWYRREGEYLLGFRWLMI